LLDCDRHSTTARGIWWLPLATVDSANRSSWPSISLTLVGLVEPICGLDSELGLDGLLTTSREPGDIERADRSAREDPPSRYWPPREPGSFGSYQNPLRVRRPVPETRLSRDPISTSVDLDRPLVPPSCLVGRDLLLFPVVFVLQLS
jgi:hypothetical protein